MRQRLLTYYFLNPRREHYLRELAGILDVDPTNLSRELKRLETDGLFAARLRGNQKYFTLNHRSPLLPDVRRIVLKTAGIVPVLERALAQVPNIREAYLYGSFAKGNSDAHSDIDVLIVGEPGLQALEPVVQRLERLFGRDVNYTLIGEAELKQKLARSDPFIADVWHGKKVKLVAA